ncbi:spore coat protein [Candidatus Omnitrophus magneticus]|uniref:dTDP-4-dehydrorhamnose reductase n=1 Tax=Candidatus Omnitrophus magneticus TaxID=1609969 RepID=A0A0F0CR62_9BACT|nr:spore coat protein [Candidatus Omnitrophus magneticus]
MKILITGSNGMLAYALEDILSPKHTLFGIDALDGEKYKLEKFFKIDITSMLQLSKIQDFGTLDLIIHTAAWTDVDASELDHNKTMMVNFKGTKNLVDIVRESAVPIIFISTDFVFDGTKKMPYIETDTPSPINTYGMSKYEGEKYVRSCLKKYAIIRTSWLFGKHGKNFVDTILKKAREEKHLKIVSDQIGSPTYTIDLAMAILKLIETGTIEKEPGEIFHAANTDQCSWHEFAGYILDTAGITDITVTPITSKELSRPAKRPLFSVLNSDKLKNFTGYHMRPWREALCEYLKSKK